MSTLTMTLPDADAERLAEIAVREGATPEQIATEAVQARLAEDAAARAEIEAGLAELDAGLGMTREDFEHEMDEFMQRLRAKHA